MFAKAGVTLHTTTGLCDGGWTWQRAQGKIDAAEAAGGERLAARSAWVGNAGEGLRDGVWCNKSWSGGWRR